MDCYQATLSHFSLQCQHCGGKDGCSSAEIRSEDKVICSLPQTPSCIWCPWTRIIHPEGDLHRHGFLLKINLQQTRRELRARRPSQGLLAIHLPDVRAQRQKAIVSKQPHPVAQQGSSHVADMMGPALPRQNSPRGQNLEEKLAKFWKKG